MWLTDSVQVVFYLCCMFEHCIVAAKFTVTIPKANPGEYFHDLNLLTKLLAPAGETSAKPPKIEVLGLYF